MTCIVGVQSEQEIWMGGDRCSSDGWSWAEAQEPKAIGSGHDAARGSLHTTHGQDMTPNTRVFQALAVAEAVTAHVRSPFDILRLGDSDEKGKRS